MNTKKFSPVYSGQLSTEEVFALNKSTIDLAKPVISSFGTITNAAFGELNSHTMALGISLNKNQKSELTDEMKRYDRARDSDLSTILAIVKNYLKSGDELKRGASSKLQLFLDPYKAAARLPIDVESAVLSEMVAKYKASEEIKTAAQSINAAEVFTSLETNNKAFDSLYNERTIEKASKSLSASSLKSKNTKAYTQFCTAIEQELAFAPSETLLALFNQLDALRKQYRPLESKTKK